MFALFVVVVLAFAPCLAEDFYSFTVKDVQGDDVSLEQYRGKVRDRVDHQRAKETNLSLLGFIGRQCKCCFVRLRRISVVV